VTVLVDSDILIEVSCGAGTAVVSRWLELGESESVALCSPATVADLSHGARPREPNTLAEVFRTLVRVRVDAETGRQAGSISAPSASAPARNSQMR